MLVLIEEVIENEDGIAIGRAWFQAPDVDGAVVVNFKDEDEKVNKNTIQDGSLVKDKILKVLGFDLEGIVVS